MNPRIILAALAAFSIAILATPAAARPVSSQAVRSLDVAAIPSYPFEAISRVQRGHRQRWTGQQYQAWGNSYQAVSYSDGERVVGGRPAGCPHAFCGCGASIYVFGENRRELWPASAWFRFPRTYAHAGAVAVRSHHVAVIIGGSPGAWLLHDSNSGGGLTREHVRDLHGYVFVDPYGEASSGTEYTARKHQIRKLRFAATRQ